MKELSRSNFNLDIYYCPMTGKPHDSSCVFRLSFLKQRSSERFRTDKFINVSNNNIIGEKIYGIQKNHRYRPLYKLYNINGYNYFYVFKSLYYFSIMIHDTNSDREKYRKFNYDINDWIIQNNIELSEKNNYEIPDEYTVEFKLLFG